MSRIIVCPSCGVILSRDPEGPPTAEAPAPTAVASAVASTRPLAPTRPMGSTRSPSRSDRPSPTRSSAPWRLRFRFPTRKRSTSVGEEPWPIVLLGSYAEPTLTLACGWLVWDVLGPRAGNRAIRS